MQRIRNVLERIEAYRYGPDLPRQGAKIRWRTTPSFPLSGYPPEVAALWSCCESAKLFADLEYGQWGLELLTQEKSSHYTKYFIVELPSHYRHDDVVVGAFMGEQDLLVVAPSESGARQLLVARAMEDRSTWYGVGPDLASFLENYLDHAGAKYWELTR
ncbi:MAG: hypothetical protein JNK64_06245 [Myxococcales bacterium]|nr:hypothetical protein [Myxococcales bacterium]